MDAVATGSAEELAVVVDRIRQLVMRLYFTPTPGVQVFQLLIRQLSFARMQEGRLLQQVIIRYGPDEAGLLAALQRAYGQGES